MSDVSKFPTADLIVDEWLTTPPRPLFLVDETRQTPYGLGSERRPRRQIVIFNLRGGRHPHCL
jgi:hypothetical protein